MMEETMMEAVAERDVGEARRESGMRKVHPSAVPTAAAVPTTTTAPMPASSASTMWIGVCRRCDTAQRKQCCLE